MFPVIVLHRPSPKQHFHAHTILVAGNRKYFHQSDFPGMRHMGSTAGT